MKEKLQSVLIVAFIIVVFVSSIGYIVADGNNQQSSSGYYQLNLVIEKQPSGNNSSNMYSFFVLNGGTIEPSNVINVPFGKEVKITIINYDPGTSLPLAQSAENVTGVVGGSILTSSSVSVSSSQGLSIQSANSVDEIPAQEISHTFTTNTGLNIPIFPHSTEVAYTYFNTVGDYSWGCMCQCGITSMDSAGSMTGELVVLPP